MSDTPCPKCGAATEDIGSKYVCGDCYWVFDKGGPAPKKGKVDVPTPQRPVLSKDPRAPLPIIAEAAPEPQAPVKCPKCMGETTDVGSGRLVCGDCYWVIDPPKAVGKAKSSFTPAASAAPTEKGEEDILSPKAVGGVVLMLVLILMIMVLALRH